MDPQIFEDFRISQENKNQQDEVSTIRRSLKVPWLPNETSKVVTTECSISDGDRRKVGSFNIVLDRIKDKLNNNT